MFSHSVSDTTTLSVSLGCQRVGVHGEEINMTRQRAGNKYDKTEGRKRHIKITRAFSGTAEATSQPKQDQ